MHLYAVFKNIPFSNKKSLAQRMNLSLAVKGLNYQSY